MSINQEEIAEKLQADPTVEAGAAEPLKTTSPTMTQPKEASLEIGKEALQDSTADPSDQLDANPKIVDEAPTVKEGFESSIAVDQKQKAFDQEEKIDKVAVAEKQDKIKPTNMTSLVNDEPEPEKMMTDDKDSDPASPDPQVEEDDYDVEWGQFERGIFDLQNKVRKDPRWFTIHLKKQLARFQGLKLYSHTKAEVEQLQSKKKPITLSFVSTHEGPKAYQHAIQFLEKQRPLPNLKWSDELHKACRDHAHDIGPKGMTSARGTDGSFPTQRIARYGTIDQSWADSCVFGALTPMEALERLIVCDGQPQRGFRQAVFNPEFSLCGICCYHHSTHENVVQLLYVDRLLKQGELPTITLQGNKAIDPSMLAKLTQMGIDKNRIKLVNPKGAGEMNVKVQSKQGGQPTGHTKPGLIIKSQQSDIVIPATMSPKAAAQQDLVNRLAAPKKVSKRPSETRADMPKKNQPVKALPLGQLLKQQQNRPSTAQTLSQRSAHISQKNQIMQNQAPTKQESYTSRASTELEGIPESKREGIKATPKKPSGLNKVSSKLFNRNSMGKTSAQKQAQGQTSSEPKSGKSRIETAKKATSGSNSAYFSQGGGGSMVKKPDDTPLKSKAFAYNSVRGSRNSKAGLQKIYSTQNAKEEQRHSNYGNRVGSMTMNDAYFSVGAGNQQSRNKAGSLSDMKQHTMDSMARKGSFLKEPTMSYTQLESGHISQRKPNRNSSIGSFKRSGSGIGGGTRQLMGNSKKKDGIEVTTKTNEYGADIDVGEYGESPKPKPDEEEHDSPAGEYGMGSIEPVSPVQQQTTTTNNDDDINK